MQRLIYVCKTISSDLAEQDGIITEYVFLVIIQVWIIYHYSIYFPNSIYKEMYFRTYINVRLWYVFLYSFQPLLKVALIILNNNIRVLENTQKEMCSALIISSMNIIYSSWNAWRPWSIWLRRKKSFVM